SQPSYSWAEEDRFNKDRATKKLSERDPSDRHGWDQGISHHVPTPDPPPAQAVGSGNAHVFGESRVHGRGSGNSSDNRHNDQPQGETWKDEGSQPLISG